MRRPVNRSLANAGRRSPDSTPSVRRRHRHRLLSHSAYVDDLEAKLDALDDARPAVRAGLAWLRANPIPEAPITLVTPTSATAT